MTKPLDLLALGLDDVLLVLQGLADPHLLLAQVPFKCQILKNKVSKPLVANESFLNGLRHLL